MRCARARQWVAWLHEHTTQQRREDVNRLDARGLQAALNSIRRNPGQEWGELACAIRLVAHERSDELWAHKRHEQRQRSIASQLEAHLETVRRAVEARADEHRRAKEQESGYLSNEPDTYKSQSITKPDSNPFVRS